MNGPLDGVRVLDLSRVLAGPLAGSILADLGADVLKVERPEVGDDLRSWGPPFADNGVSTYYVSVNRNKDGLAVDLKDQAGVELIKALAADCDVVIENFKVGEATKLGLGYEALREVNPRLVYCSISGFGQTGPWARKPGYDVLMQAMSGLMAGTGEPAGTPMRSSVAIVDICTGQFAAIGILAALNARSATGTGQRVDVSLLETALAMQPNLTAGVLIADQHPARLGNGHPNVTPYGAFPTQDGHIVLAIGNDDQWRRLCAAFGAHAAEVQQRYPTNKLRMAARSAVDDIVASWTSEYRTADLLRLMNENGVPHAPVRGVGQALELEQVQCLGAIGDYPLDESGMVRLVNLPIHLSAGGRTVHSGPPVLAEPTADRLRGLGLGDEVIEAFLRNRRGSRTS